MLDLQYPVLPRDEFLETLNRDGVKYSEEPIKLRAGGFSHWYVDHREGLGTGDMMLTAGALLVEKANELGIEWDVVAGAGVGGWGLAISVARAGKKSSILVQLDKSDTSLKNGYGCHGADAEGNRVLLVDDIGTSGGSLLELLGLVLEEGGLVTDAINVSDRSKGLADAAMQATGVSYHYLFTFDEEKNLLVPAA